MEELYVKMEDGSFSPDRRIKKGTSMDLQQYDMKVLAKVESMEMNIETKLEAVKDKISNLDEKLGTRIEIIEKQLDGHMSKEDDYRDTIYSLKGNSARILELEENYSLLLKRVEVLESASIRGKAKWIDSFLSVLQKTAFGAVATGIIGFVAFLIFFYLKSGGK